MSTIPLDSRLTAARRRRGWTQECLAKATGLQPSAIGHFETGRRLPSAKNLLKLASALAVTADYLLGRTPNLDAANEALETGLDLEKLGRGRR